MALATLTSSVSSSPPRQPSASGRTPRSTPRIMSRSCLCCSPGCSACLCLRYWWVRSRRSSPSPPEARTSTWRSSTTSASTWSEWRWAQIGFPTRQTAVYVGPSGDGPASQDLVPVYVEHSEKFRRARDSPVFTRKNDDRRRPEYTFQNYFRS